MGLTIVREDLPYDEYLTMVAIKEEERRWEEEVGEYNKVDEMMERAREQSPNKGFVKVEV